MLTMLFDQHPAKDGPAESAKSMVDALEEALHGGPQLGVRVVGDEAAAGSPDSGVGDPWQSEVSDDLLELTVTHLARIQMEERAKALR